MKLKMKVVCCGCQKEMGYKDRSWGGKEEVISHGICDSCIKRLYGPNGKTKEKSNE
jgi:hypothetical protein